MARARSRSKIAKILEAIAAGKHYAVLKELAYLKKKCELVKEIKLEYGADEKEKFMQVTVPGEGTYIIYIVYRRNNAVGHRFYTKQATKKVVKDHEYNVISMRIPSELRGSTLYIKIFRCS